MNSRFRVLLLSGVSLLALIAVLTLVLPAMADHQPPSISKLTANQEADPPPGIDLDVTFINRTPLYKAYCVQYPWDDNYRPGIPYLCPGTENDQRWPEPGEVVTFTAHVINKGTVASPAVGYVWHIDGAEVASGTLPALAPAAEVTATYRWPWAHTLSLDGQRALGEHAVRFTVDPADVVAETYETNNRLEDRTNAMSFSIYLPANVYDSYNVPVDPKWPWSTEDWLQKQVAAMNAAFANSIYPVTPQGAALRVRINTIGVTPTDPGPDGAHDGSWYLRDDFRHCCGYYDPATDISWGLVRELSHQVSIIDMSAIGVYAANVFVQDRNGISSNFGFGWRGGGIMGGGDTGPYNDPQLYDSTSAGGASTFAGYRNGYSGSYLFDIPLQNYLRILDSQGNPAPGVAVSLYQRTGPYDFTGHMGVDNTPEIKGTTDALGIFSLPNRSANGGTVTANGHVLHDNPFGVVDVIGNQGLFLIKLARPDHEEFHWLDITQFNLAYWMGDVISHTFTISSHVPPPGGPVAPELLMPRVEGARASLGWAPSPSQGVIGYRVYRATPPLYEYVAASGLLTATYFEEEFGGEYNDGLHRVYAVVAVDGSGRESGFGEFVYAPGIADPVAVAIAPDGARMVLNNGNLYPLLRQQSDGRFAQRLVNLHYDLGTAHYLAYDPLDRLLVSGFGDSRFGRKAVRVYDGAMRSLFAFGDEGSEPGQFVVPSGLAWWGPPCTYGGPYREDSHTLLLLHFNGSYAGAQGEPGRHNGTSFAEGRYGQGVLINEADTLTYPTAGNLDGSAGTIEFWVRPQWNGDDRENHSLFATADPANQGIHIYKDVNGYLHFVVWTPEFHDGAGCSLSAWRTGEWHHLAVTWSAKEVSVYADGWQCNQQDGVPPPVGLDGRFYVGSTPGGEWQADAVIDELRISDVPRLGNGDSCGRILVADSGNNRVQAFDTQGNLISAYGTPGSGPGQFNNPQGLAVHSSGRVIVADSGNHRLQLLSFDGANFGFLRSITAGFNAPTGVTTFGQERIIVADTGNDTIVALVRDGSGFDVVEYSQPNDGYTGPFNAPRGVAVEPDGDIVVADTGNRRVVTIRSLSGQNRVYLPMVRK